MFKCSNRSKDNTSSGNRIIRNLILTRRKQTKTSHEHHAFLRDKCEYYTETVIHIDPHYFRWSLHGTEKGYKSYTLLVVLCVAYGSLDHTIVWGVGVCLTRMGLDCRVPCPNHCRRCACFGHWSGKLFCCVFDRFLQYVLPLPGDLSNTFPCVFTKSPNFLITAWISRY